MNNSNSESNSDDDRIWFSQKQLDEMLDDGLDYPFTNIKRDLTQNNRQYMLTGQLNTRLKILLEYKLIDEPTYDYVHLIRILKRKLIYPTNLDLEDLKDDLRRLVQYFSEMHGHAAHNTKSTAHNSKRVDLNDMWMYHKDKDLKDQMNLLDVVVSIYAYNKFDDKNKKVIEKFIQYLISSGLKIDHLKEYIPIEVLHHPHFVKMVIEANQKAANQKAANKKAANSNGSKKKGLNQTVRKKLNTRVLRNMGLNQNMESEVMKYLIKTSS